MMSTIQKILKTLFVLTIIVSSLNVYGYNLKYKGEYIDTGSGTGVCEIIAMTEAYKDTVKEYQRRSGGSGGWLTADASDKGSSGGAYSFGTPYYIFYRMSDPVPSTYNSGFNTSRSNLTNNNVYYDSNDANGVNTDITISSTNFSNFRGIAVNIPESGRNTANYMSMEKFAGNPMKIDLLRWKVTPSGVAIHVYQLTNEALKDLKEKYGEEMVSGIRISNVLRTKYSGIDANTRNYLDTAWLFFKSTVDNGWSNSGRGFSDPWPDNEDTGYKAYATDSYKKGASVANEYDNILYIPDIPIKKPKRDIYVNHVDEQGNVIDGLQRYSQNMVVPPGTSRASTDPKHNYQEHYLINAGETIAIKKSGVTKIGDASYTFKFGKYATGSSEGAATNALPFSSNTWSSDTANFTTNPNNSDDALVINLVYSKYVPLNVPLELVGRLEFINRNTAYLGSTVNHDTDYIPANKELTPFVQSAYPYVVRALRYEPREESKTSSATVTSNIVYEWDIWTYQHGSATEIDDPGHPASAGPPPVAYKAPTYKHKHDSTCGWYKTTSSASTSKVFNYTVPYKHSWFEITNFKMYRISKLEVFDNEDNTGGTLFEGGTYTIGLSNTYESRFSGSRGRVPRTLTVSFPNKSYDLPKVYEPMSKPSGGTETASGTSVNSKNTALATATSKLNAETHKTASDATTLTISYAYDNDFIELDGMTDMLQRNYKTWSEKIEKETDTAVRDLNSKASGTGKDNGSAISYTSNLMSYMKPTTKLTTDSDFAETYKKVPVDRENGLRQLEAKIYYNITNDPKYNVGSVDFDSTDATYRLNNLWKLSALDFAEQNRTYENSDVNKVNVLTPENFGDFNLITNKMVDHTTGAGNSTILQKNAEFTITPATTSSSTGGYSLTDTREFVKGYYFIFDFNILYEGKIVEAGTPIYIEDRNATLRAKTTDSFDSGSASQLTNSIRIVAITINITDALKAKFDAEVSSSNTYIDFINNKVRTTGVQNQRGLLRRADIINDSYHAIYKVITTKNVGRIFDFAVTDCTDIAYKDVFRLPNDVKVNEHNAVAYYSGYKYWNLYSSEYNEMLNRTNLGTAPQKILPLGPYKNTNTRYVNAPKMGYRISFDLKTTGYMQANNSNESRRVEITPKYYYISKDGKTFDNNIDLYFKNNSGKYINYASSGYTIYYKPDDGYRYIRNSAYTDENGMMSKKLESLAVSSKIVLSSKSMGTNNTSFIQAWYGEFKLPNSTIAISKTAGNIHNNINNPYSDGYIGVIFDIKCIDTNGFTVSYDTSDKSAGSQTNTSQWDYEGFMGFKTPGQATEVIKYQLEKDIWLIDNARYQQIKGTVALFDLDNRAANDFE